MGMKNRFWGGKKKVRKKLVTVERGKRWSGRIGLDGNMERECLRIKSILCSGRCHILWLLKMSYTSRYSPACVSPYIQVTKTAEWLWSNKHYFKPDESFYKLTKLH